MNVHPVTVKSTTESAAQMKRELTREGCRQWCAAVLDAQHTRRPYSHFECFALRQRLGAR